MYPKHIKSAFAFVASVIIILTISTSSRVFAEPRPDPSIIPMAAEEDNLLSNPGLNGDYYNPAHSNHYVAVDWIRWIIPATWVPEYVDTPDWYGTPIPAFEGDNSQRWHSWNGEYYSGLYQMIENIEPCTLYQFSMWSRKSPNPTNGIIEHHIGIDPFGTQYTPSIDDPYTTVAHLANIVWSADHQLLGTWEQLSMSTEALSGKLSAVMFSKATRPDNAVYTFDSFYDAGSLVQIPFPDGRLPAPETWSANGVITNLNVSVGTTEITINWETTVPASTQVWYDYTMPATSSALEPMTYTLYSPIVQNIVSPTRYVYESDIDATPTTSHSVTITNLPEHAEVVLAPLSRYVSNGACITSGYEPIAADLP